MNLPRPASPRPATMQVHGRTFWLASRMLPRHERGRIEALYRFCRQLDDLADTASAPASTRQVLAGLAGALRGGDLRAAQLAPIRAALVAGELPAGPVATFVQALADDCGPRVLADEDELIAYAYGVAGTVGELLCALFGVSAAAQLRRGVALGIGMQLTNIVRDVVEDAGRGRIYLPAAWLGDAADPARLAARDPPAIELAAAAADRVLELAERHYALAREGIDGLPLRVRPAIAAAASMYREIGAQWRHQPAHARWASRAVVPTWRRALVGGAAALGALVQRKRVAMPANLSCGLPTDAGAPQ